MNERALLKRLKQKNEKALEETIQLYTAYTTTIIREILNSKATVEDIEELVADTFISLWQSAGKINYMQYSSLKAYIGEIARNKAKDLNILRWRSHPISWNRAMESVIESHSSDGGSHDPCRGSQ